MVPISRRKQIAGVVAAMALGYALSWLLTPGPGTGPVKSFGSTFGQTVAPVIVSPDPAAAHPRPLENHEKDLAKPLQKERPEPI